MSAEQLGQEVVKQLSKDSYGVSQVAIPKEVLTLLSAQQEHIKAQEKQLLEYQTKLQTNAADSEGKHGIISRGSSIDGSGHGGRTS